MILWRKKKRYVLSVNVAGVTKWDIKSVQEIHYKTREEAARMGRHRNKWSQCKMMSVKKYMHTLTYRQPSNIEGEEQRLKNKIQFDSSWSAFKCMAFVCMYMCMCKVFFHRLKMSCKFAFFLSYFLFIFSLSCMSSRNLLYSRIFAYKYTSRRSTRIQFECSK